MTDSDTKRAVEIVSQDGTTWHFRTWPQFIRWLEETLAAWQWVPVGGHDPANLTHYIPTRLNAAIGEAHQFRDAGSDIAQANSIMDRHLRDGYAAPHPSTERAKRIFEIRDVAGDREGKFAFGIMQGLLNWQSVNSNEDWRALSLILNPELLLAAGDAQRFVKERSNYRSALLRQSSDFDQREEDRQAAWNDSVSSAGDAAGDFAKVVTRRWMKTAIKLRRRERAAMERLRATDAAFTEKMALKAPVEYWEKKAERHRKAEWWARLWVLIYFPVALGSIGSAFWFTGQYLLQTPQASLPPGLYIIASAGLASSAGLLFWAGRLLTKLYLSQHHLRQDADERATMTTTYLALTAEQAASDGDRTIILNALFRNTPDGIVKEDGGLDPSIAAALGKFLAKP